MLLRLQPTEAVATSSVAATRARDFSLMARGSLREARARRPGVYWGVDVYCASRDRAGTGRRQRPQRGATRPGRTSPTTYGEDVTERWIIAPARTRPLPHPRRAGE